MRFSAWQGILDTPAPDSALRHVAAMWNHARGRALIATGKIAEAERSLARVRAAGDDPSVQDVRLEFNDVPAILRIAVQLLNGKIASAQGRHDDAITGLEQSLRAQGKHSQADRIRKAARAALSQ